MAISTTNSTAQSVLDKYSLNKTSATGEGRMNTAKQMMQKVLTLGQ